MCNFPAGYLPVVQVVMGRYFSTIVCLLALSLSLSGQKVLRNTSILNYQRGDRVFMHFGFTLGVNYMDYRAVLSASNPLRAETGEMDIGFMVAIVSELRITEDLGLRFLPGLEFATRRLVYTHVPDTEVGKLDAFNESVYISLPLMMKYKAKRINNFRPYITAGPSVKYDFQNHKKIDPDNSVYFRTKPWDVFLETGLGCDFYLPYFKFGIELRFAFGMTNVLKKDYDVKNPGYEVYTDTFRKLHARIFTVCFNFE